MKALASEVSSKLKYLLKSFKVLEYTGDTEVESSILQDANVIVCTPEKFDAATRKHSCPFYNIKLVIIDEIHLLEDDRGAVLESIVARLLKGSELRQQATRIIGLSATLPNYDDVAKFIKAEEIHYFDKSFRPVPLRMTITGFTKVSKYSDECDYLLEKVAFFMEKKKQVMIFVHSRVKTAKIADFLCKNLSDSFNLEPEHKFKFRGDLRRFAQKSVGIHHAGLCREDRLESETCFKKGILRILVCTSTLAWGVNLPAYCVIINGSTFYNTLKGSYDDLGVLDILQIFGRAGRPQYDSMGEAFLMTNANKIDHYVKLLKRNQSIESKLFFHFPESLNAEIYLNNICSISSALFWFKNTFLYVRLLKNPAYYGILPEEMGLEEQAISEYVYLAVKRLEDCGMIRIEKKEDNYNTWNFKSTFYGQIASIYYLHHLTMHTWLSNINTTDSESSLIDLLLKSEELKNITVRKEEVSYLATLHQSLILDCILDFEFDETLKSKLLILLASFLHFRTMPIFSLACDTDYLIENLKRLVSAMKEILLFLKKYNLFSECFVFEKNLCRYKKSKNNGEQMKLIRIDDNFVDLSVRIPKQGSYSVFILNKSKIEYVFNTSGNFNHIFRFRHKQMKVEIHSNKDWNFYEKELIPVCDYSVFGLYKYGRHVCDLKFDLYGMRKSCAHFQEFCGNFCSDEAKKSTTKNKFKKESEKCRDLSTEDVLATVPLCLNTFAKLAEGSKDETFNRTINFTFLLDIHFIEVVSTSAKERLKLISYLIYDLNLDSVLIICPNSSDVIETQNFLNNKQSIDDLSSLGNPDKQFMSGDSSKNLGNRWISTLKQAKSVQKFKNVVFKGIYSQNHAYPVFEIFKISQNKKTFVFDHQNNIEYLKTLLKES